MNEKNSFAIVEKLVATVARAFYNDTVVVVLDALLREKFLMEEELGPRLRLPPKEVRKILNLLEEEMLVNSEDVFYDDSDSFLKCYYIDYQNFVNVVRYRVYLMNKHLISAERNELNEVYYQCPTCTDKFSSLQVLTMLSSDGKFICSHCALANGSLKATKSEQWFRLVEVDNRGKLTGVQQLEKKFHDQMGKTEQHEGVLEMLRMLRDINLGHNKPSDNMQMGIRSSTVVDSEILEEITENVEFLANGKFGSSRIKKKNEEAFKAFQTNATRPDIHINIESETTAKVIESRGSVAASLMHRDNTHVFQNREAHVPEFLRESGVKGAQSVLLEAAALQAQRDNQFSADSLLLRHGHKGEEPLNKKPKLAEEPKPLVNIITEPEKPQQAVDDEDEHDDVEWED